MQLEAFDAADLETILRDEIESRIDLDRLEAARERVEAERNEIRRRVG